MGKKEKFIWTGAGILLVALVVASFLSSAVQMFLWKYFWGPIVADAHNQSVAVYNGVEAAKNYNVFDTTFYAALVALSAFGVYKLFRKIDINIDKGLVFSLIPFVIFGEFLRVIEDAAILSYPYNIFLIFPISGLIILLLAVGVLYISKRLQDKGTIEDYQRPVLYTALIASTVSAVVLLWHGFANGFGKGLLGLTLTPLIALGVFLVIQNFLGGIWPETFLNSSVGLLATAGHVLDGSVTSYSLSSLGYIEKHIVASWIIENFGTAYAFLAVKVAVIFTILGMIEKEGDREFKLLVLLFIIAVGLGPGVRSFTRAFLGV